MKEKLKILIAVPCMDMVNAQFAQSLATLNKTGECAVSFVLGSLIYDSRNKLAQQALSFEADYIMWFDSDMCFQPNTLLKLLEDDKDIVSGLYFRRAMPYTPVAFSKIAIDEKGEADFEDYKGELSGLHQIGGVGFGCVLMKTDVIMECMAKYGTCFSPIAGYGEDLSFCWRAQQLGYEIWLDADVKCGHCGHIVVTQNFYEACSEGENDESES